MKGIVYWGFSTARCDRLAFRLSRSTLRILNYHGVCQDRLAGETWMPPSFVSLSAFEQQLAYLRKRMHVLTLSEAILRLKNNSLPERSAAITFDDGYANNLHLAYPALAKHGLPATIFLTTHYIESGDFFPFDRPRLASVRNALAPGWEKAVEDFHRAYKREPLDLAMERADSWWSCVRTHVSPEQRETLRPFRVEELQQFDPQLIEFGAHTHRHPILRNESLARREWEISSSIERVSEWTGRPVKLFAYPNGDRADFGELDKQVLHSRGIQAAVTTIPGTNRFGCDFLELRRFGISLGHDRDAFVAEFAGFRTLITSLLKRQPHAASVTYQG